MHDDRHEAASSLPFFVVGLGASAGGLEALEQFFDRMPGDVGCAFVVVQHLSPGHKSLMAELLARHTPMPVSRATDGLAVEPNHVYLNDAKNNLVIEGGRLRLVARSGGSSLNLPIDLFFESLAKHQGARSIGVVLSGTGSDGMRGVRAIKAGGGHVFVQDAASARFDGMPRSAISTGLVDAVLPPAQMPDLVGRAVRDPLLLRVFLDHREDPATEADAYAQLMALVTQATTVDFSHYKRNTVLRRVARRIAATESEDLQAYLRLARSSSTEVDLLLKELLISVTRFFRDPDVWTHLQEHVLLPLVEQAPADQPLRVWVAGCATGEEAYTVGMLLSEAMERSARTLDVRIFATDMDKAALEVASAGIYGPSIAQDVSAPRLARFFEWKEDHYVVRRELRQLVVLAQHNLVSDPPFTRVSLVSCRNLLIYLDQTLQERALAAFRFALKRGATLVLGTSETVGDRSDAFEPIDGRLRIYRAIGDRPVAAMFAREPLAPRPAHVASDGLPRSQHSRVVESATGVLLEAYAPAAVLVDESFRLLHVFGDVAPYMKIPTGQANLNLLTMLPRALSVVAAAGVPRVIREDRERRYTGIRSETGSGSIGMRLMPLIDTVLGRRLAIVVFEPGAAAGAPGPETALIDMGAETERQLADLQQELQHSRENLQAMVEELETSNEELQAINEELTSSNEELQSTNEELQAVNEELYTVNAEHERKIAELIELNNDIDNILRSTSIGTLLLDDQLTVRKFTPSASSYVSLLERDVGRPVDHLAMHFGGESFVTDCRAVLLHGQPAERPMTTERGRHVLVRMSPYLTRSNRPTGVVVSFIDVTSLAEANERTQKVLDSMPQHVAMLDRRGTIIMVNAAWERFAAENGGSVHASIGVGANYLEVCAPHRLPPNSEGHEARQGLERLLADEIDQYVLEYPCHSLNDQRWYLMHASRITGSGGVVVSHIDITDRKLAEISLRELAMVDPLTGLLNRRGFAEYLTDELERARRHASTLSAIFIDCDDFKQINDRFGHATGDRVLATLARGLSDSLRPTDRMARIGGDEFLVLLPETRLMEAALVADRLRLAGVGERIHVGQDMVPLTVSLAVTPVDVDTGSIDDILRNARVALQDSKVRGKNRITLATSTATIESPTGPRDVAHLLRAPDVITVARQPIMRLVERQVAGHEFLSRGPDGPLNLPQDFFRRAGEDGLLSALDLRCLSACLRAAAQSGEGWHHLNLYPSTLLETPVEQLLRLFPEPATRHQYCIELSEQQLLGNPSTIRDAVAALRRADLRVAIDDVGFGRTSLESLVLLEPEVVKLDRRWVAGIGHERGRVRTLKRLVEVADTLGALVIAEGIESEEEVALLVDLGVRYGQGYLWGEPVAVSMT